MACAGLVYGGLCYCKLSGTICIYNKEDLGEALAKVVTLMVLLLVSKSHTLLCLSL